MFYESQRLSTAAGIFFAASEISREKAGALEILEISENGKTHRIPIPGNDEIIQIVNTRKCSLMANRKNKK